MPSQLLPHAYSNTNLAKPPTPQPPNPPPTPWLETPEVESVRPLPSCSSSFLTTLSWLVGAPLDMARDFSREKANASPCPVWTRLLLCLCVCVCVFLWGRGVGEWGCVSRRSRLVHSPSPFCCGQRRLGCGDENGTLRISERRIFRNEHIASSMGFHPFSPWVSPHHGTKKGVQHELSAKPQSYPGYTALPLLGTPCQRKPCFLQYIMARVRGPMPPLDKFPKVSFRYLGRVMPISFQLRLGKPQGKLRGKVPFPKRPKTRSVIFGSETNHLHGQSPPDFEAFLVRIQGRCFGRGGCFNIRSKATTPTVNPNIMANCGELGPFLAPMQTSQHPGHEFLLKPR